MVRLLAAASGSWRCKFEIGRGADGRRQTRYLTVRGTRKDAEKAMIDALKAASDGTFVDASKLTVGEYLEKWLTDYATTAVAAKTLERYAEIVRNHLVPGLGAIALRELKPLDIQGYYAIALASGRIKGGALSPRTVHHHHVILSQALARAVKWRLLAINPAEAVDPPRVHQQEIEVLNDDELATLLRAAQDTRSYPAILLAATTGMRRGEVLGLRWRDLDLDGAKLAVAVSLEETKSGLRVKAPKTRSSKRTITLAAVTVEALRRHRAQVLRERLALGLGRDDKGPVFANLEGEHIRPRNFTKEFGRIVKRARVRSITLHGLRHSHITSLLRAGVNAKVVSERAGHASVGITLTLYAHALPDMQAEAAAKVDAALRGALEE